MNNEAAVALLKEMVTVLASLTHEVAMLTELTIDRVHGDQVRATRQRIADVQGRLDAIRALVARL